MCWMPYYWIVMLFAFFWLIYVFGVRFHVLERIKEWSVKMKDHSSRWVRNGANLVTCPDLAREQWPQISAVPNLSFDFVSQRDLNSYY